MSTSAAAERLARLRCRLAELGLKALLVSHPANVRYLTGFSGSSAWLLVGERPAILATDGRYAEQAEEEVAGDAGVELLVVRERVLSELVQRADREFAGARVGFEGDRLSYGEWERLREEAARVEWAAVSGTVERLRAVKEARELRALKRAAGIAVEALGGALSLAEPGARELEVAAEIDHRMRLLGAEGPAFETIVASGARAALPHATSSSKQIEEGDLLVVDFGARWQGYCSDMTRTFVVGDPAPRQVEVYDLVLAAQRAACGLVRAGKSGKEIDEAARMVFEEKGLGERFLHSTGHGVGLEVHESPRLGREAEDVLEVNMVVTVEPGLYFAGWGGMRIEDCVVVTREGSRPLSTLEKDRLESVPA